jgi:hypothetical protein
MYEREESPIYSSARKEQTKTTTPEWQTQALAAAADNMSIQGDEFTNSSITATARVKNHCQIFEKVAEISGSNLAVDHYGYDNEMSYQLELKTKELKRDIERGIVQNNASVAAANAVAGECGGIETWISTNASRGAGGAGTGYNSGTGLTVAPTDGTQRVLTEQLLLDVMKTGYDNGARFSTIYCGSFNKMRISNTMTGNQTRFSEEAKSLSNTIDVYENDFGKVQIVKNPQMRTRTLILVDPDAISIKNLRAMQRGKIAKTADSEREFVLAELTTRVVEKGLGVIADLTTA